MCWHNFNVTFDIFLDQPTVEWKFDHVFLKLKKKIMSLTNHQKMVMYVDMSRNHKKFEKFVLK